MALARIAAVVALLAVVLPASAGSSVKGDVRVLVVLATDGPTPYEIRDVQRVARETNALLRASSFGQVRLTVDVTQWLSAWTADPGCGGGSDTSLDKLIAPARVAADDAGYAPERYERVVYALGDSHCGFFGVTWGRQVVLTRPPTVQLLAHELGHTFGLGHAHASPCVRGRVVNDTGDPFSPMGEGPTDLSPYEKSLLGWIGHQPRATASRTYSLVPANLRPSGAQALVIGVEAGQWWLEYRTKPFRGLLVRFVDRESPATPFLPSADLMLDPTHRNRPWVARGETYTSPDFTVRLVGAQARQAQIRFTWRSGRRP